MLDSRRWVSHLPGCSHLELGVNVLEAFGVLGQLLADVLGADEDALQMAPGALHFEPNRNHLAERASVLA